MTKRLRAEGILVYYYPYHQIRHRYGRRGIFTTVSKCFDTGRNGWRYHKKYSNGSAGSFRLILGGIIVKSGALLNAFWRARQSSSVGEFLLYLPFMFLFEISNKIGFLWGFLISRLNGGNEDY